MGWSRVGLIERSEVEQLRGLVEGVAKVNEFGEEIF